jgi:hypothetical protein
VAAGNDPASILAVNFLQIAQRTAVECGAAASQSITTALPTVVGASGALGRIVNWINDGWTDIQMDHDDWSWMRSSNILRLSGTDPLGAVDAGVQFVTVAGQATYPLDTGAGTVGIDPETFGKWVERSFRCYTTANGFRDEQPLGQIGFDRWRNGYMTNAQRLVRTRPYVIAVGPDLSLNIGPPSNGNYTITGDYFVAPSNMVLDADIPVGLPTRFHMLIVYRAMMKYGGFMSAPDVYQRGQEENAGMYAQLQALRAPRIRTRGALA